MISVRIKSAPSAADRLQARLALRATGFREQIVRRGDRWARVWVKP